MSPEQARGGKLTTATDVYGIASVIYECLAGRGPFEGHLGEKGERRYPQLEIPVPSLGLYYDGSTDMVALLDSALSDEPSQRPTIEELRNRIKDAAGIDPEAPRETGAPAPQPDP
jgi:serine/threonine protein kinase